MSKYTTDDTDVKELEDSDKASYESYLLNFNVDANVETAKGRDALQGLVDAVKSKKITFNIGNMSAFYPGMMMVLMGIAALAFVICLVYFIVMVFKHYMKDKNDVSKAQMKLSGLFVLFAVGLFSIVFLVVRMRDKVQNYLDKIVYKL